MIQTMASAFRTGELNFHAPFIPLKVNPVNRLFSVFVRSELPMNLDILQHGFPGKLFKGLPKL